MKRAHWQAFLAASSLATTPALLITIWLAAAISLLAPDWRVQSGNLHALFLSGWGLLTTILLPWRNERHRTCVMLAICAAVCAAAFPVTLGFSESKCLSWAVAGGGTLIALTCAIACHALRTPRST